MNLNKINIERTFNLNFVWINILKPYYSFEILIVVGNRKLRLCQLNTASFVAHLVEVVI
jgi:hypothetical protein